MSSVLNLLPHSTATPRSYPFRYLMMVRPKRSPLCIFHQSLKRRDASMPQFPRDSLRHSLRKQQRRSSMQKRRERQRQSRMLFRRPAQSVRQTLLQQIKRRPRFFLRQPHSPVRVNQLILIRMFQRELEIPQTKLLSCMRPPHIRKHDLLRPLAQQFQNVPLIAESLIQSRSRRPRRPRHRAHSQRLLSAPAPQLISGIQNAPFQTSISCSRHFRSLRIRPTYVSPKIIFTMYNKRCISYSGAQYTPFHAPVWLKIPQCA